MQRRRWTVRWSAAALGVVALVVITPSRAAAHTELTSSSPPSGASVADLDTIELRFSRAVEPAASRVWVSHEAGILELGPPLSPRGRSSLAVAVPPLDDGAYEVAWQVMAEDGARTGGRFSFAIGLPAALDGPTIAGVPVRGTEPGEAGEEGSGTGDAAGTNWPPATSAAPGLPGVDSRAGHGDALAGSLARGLLDASLATLVGGLAFVAGVWPQGGRVRRTRLVLWVAALVAALASFELTALQHASAVGLGRLEAVLPSNQWSALQFRFGAVAAARVGPLAASALLTARLGRRSGTTRSIVWCTAVTVVALGLIESVVLVGHASSPGALAAGARLLHVLGVSLWIGGLVMLLCVVVPRRRVDELLAVLPRFSAMATVAVASLVVGGAFLAVDLLGSAGALPSTGYGRVLLAKVGVVGVLLVVAARSRRHVRSCLLTPAPPAARSVVRPLALWVGTEIGLLAIVLGLTAVLVSRVPPT